MPQYGKWKARLGELGVNVVEETLDVGNHGFVNRVAGQLTLHIDPSQATFLSMLHESRHVAQILRAGREGVDLLANKRLVAFAERGAYAFERRVGKAYGFSQEYMGFIQSQIAHYITPVMKKYQRSGSFRGLVDSLWL